jgi:hypothetical protein
MIGLVAPVVAACSPHAASSQPSGRPEGSVARASATVALSPTEAAAIVPASPIRAHQARLMDPGVLNTGRVRYPLLDRGDGRTLIFVTEAGDKARWAAVAGAMPIVQSFEFAR